MNLKFGKRGGRPRFGGSREGLKESLQKVGELSIVEDRNVRGLFGKI